MNKSPLPSSASITNEFQERSKRAQAVERYFSTDDFLEGAGDAIKQYIIEGGREWTTFRPYISGASMGQGFGAYKDDMAVLAVLEAKLKAKFPCVDHLRFEIEHSFTTVMIDTKPATWLRKKLIHPERSGGSS